MLNTYGNKKLCICKFAKYFSKDALCFPPAFATTRRKCYPYDIAKVILCLFCQRRKLKYVTSIQFAEKNICIHWTVVMNKILYIIHMTSMFYHSVPEFFLKRFALDTFASQILNVRL